MLWHCKHKLVLSKLAWMVAKWMGKHTQPNLGRGSWQQKEIFERGRLKGYREEGGDEAIFIGEDCLDLGGLYGFFPCLLLLFVQGRSIALFTLSSSSSSFFVCVCIA